MALVTEHGGLTNDEMLTLLGRWHNSVHPTVSRLVRRGLLVDSGERRPTRTGCPAIVWAVGDGTPPEHPTRRKDAHRVAEELLKEALDLLENAEPHWSLYHEGEAGDWEKRRDALQAAHRRR